MLRAWTSLRHALYYGGPIAVAYAVRHPERVSHLILYGAYVFERLGLRLLRTAWINLDLVWAGALTCTAVLTVLV